MDKWNYYEIESRHQRTVGLVQCPKCLKTMTWRNYNEFLKGIRYCPWCGTRLEGIYDPAMIEAEEWETTENT